ncbi:deubiquitinase OTUD6B [Arctopsyche grandis]|uniref:deubiquitinase OTUD6B n=1 Tax=Arctopsyche grandis TaxID=121162 RepID=UPI00406D70F3
MEAGEGEGAGVEVDNQIETREQQQQRHRQEKRLLQAQIQQLKKAAGKPDKKKKKELDVLVNKLEEDLRKTHLNEAATFTNCHVDIEQPESQVEDEQEPQPEPEHQESTAVTRISRAQRRRDKKTASEVARTQEIADSIAAGAGAERIAETRVIQKALKKRGLTLWSISPDGNCLYSAIRHQLAAKSRPFLVRELRHLAAKYIRANRNDLSPFMCDPVTGDTLTDQQFERYCRDVSDTNSWGGQIELQALASSLKTAIHVVQAAPPGLIIQGEEYSKSGDVIVLTYHRHLYGLGEHYNSTREMEPNDNSPEE